MSDASTPPRGPDGPPPDWEALARYLAGESPAAEARAVAAWLAAHPADAALLERLDATVARAAGVAAAGRPEAPIDVEGALARARARRDADGGVLPLRRPERAPGRPAAGARRWRVGALVAAAAALALAAGLWQRAGGPADRADAPAGGVAAAGRVFETAVGARDSVRLPDGTRVVLAPASRLVVAAGYGGAAREVTLEGVAWFSVRHDEARPFTVRAGGAVVRDLGTEFVVRADGGTRGVGVAVTEGTVALAAGAAGAAPAPGAPGAADTGVVLAAGDRGELRADGRVVALRGVVTGDDVAWTRGRLVYREAPLDVLRADLRRWYGVELRVADSTLAARRFTGEFAGDPVDDVLRVVALALGAEVERAGDTATLRPR